MADTGSLSARTFAAGMAVPVAGVAVTVTSAGEGAPALIAFRTTDENGLMEPIPLPAPEEELSLAPGEAQPFSTCNVQFDHPDYYTTFVENVQIFPGRQSIQGMEMLPLAEDAPEEERGYSYTITPQNL